MAKKKEVSEKDKKNQLKSKRIATNDSSVIVTQAYKSESKKEGKRKTSISRKQEESKSVSFSASKEDKKRDKIIVEASGRLRKRKLEKILFVIILVLLILILIVLAFYLYNYPNNGERMLETNENIESAVVKEDILYIDLFETDFGSIEKIKFIFLGNQEYTLETYEINEFYEIYPEEIGLDNFDSIEKVSAIYEYTPSVNDTVTPAPPTNQTTNKTNDDGNSGGSGGSGGDTCTSTCNSLGYECGIWTICGSSKNCGVCGTGKECASGKCEEICEDECDAEGLFCDGNANMPYNCTKKSDGCFDRTNLTACTTGYQCVSGACQIIPSCNNNSDCVSFTNTCSVGICNTTGKCEIVYNSTTSLCRAITGDCDIEEHCDGSSANCPANEFKPDGTDCSLSTIDSGVCSEGECVGCINDNNCDDEVGCTTDVCNLLANICEYNPDDSLCLDGNWCNGAETCDVVLDCQPGEPPDCSDEVLCTLDICFEGTPGDNLGICQHDNSGCSCATNEQCYDNNTCTDDTCNTVFECESIENDSNICDDDLYCTVGDYCSNGICLGNPRDCGDGVACTDDFCNPLTGCENNENDSKCLPSEYCNSTSGCQLLVLTCDGTDLSCGIYPDCNNCNNLDGCDIENRYLDYYCNSSTCDFLDITAEESIADGNCLDGIDNDCDGSADREDADCTTIFPKDYIAYWKLDEILEEEHIIPEETGLHNATFRWAPEILIDPVRGNVTAFDAIQDYLEVEDDEELHPPVFTYSAWIKRAINDSTQDYIISNGFDRNFYVGNNSLAFQTGPASLVSNTKIEVDRWYHVAFTYDGQYARLYLNGMLDKEDDMVINLGGTPDFNIAKCQFNHAEHLFNGSIDDVMVYNRSLSELEIREIYDAQNTIGVSGWEVASLSLTDRLRNLIRDLFDFLS